MAWQNQAGVQDLINSYKALQLLGIKLPFGQRGGSAKPRQQQVQPGSKEWSALTRSGWTCSGSQMYNFGFRTTCFGCKVCQRPADQIKPQGNQQADLLANQGTERLLDSDLEPDPVWLSWQDFAMKVHQFWRLVGPQLRDRPEEQPRVKLPIEPLAPSTVAPGRVRDTDEPFQLGEHQRVVKHASFLQCLDCNRHAGRVKATGKHNFAYMGTQDCRPLKIKKHKKRPTGIPEETQATSSLGVTPVGDATGGPFLQAM
eukprot:6203362-Amphidinium_carterae.1